MIRMPLLANERSTKPSGFRRVMAQSSWPGPVPSAVPPTATIFPSGWMATLAPYAWAPKSTATCPLPPNVGSRWPATLR